MKVFLCPNAANSYKAVYLSILLQHKNKDNFYHDSYLSHFVRLRLISCRRKREYL